MPTYQITSSAGLDHGTRVASSPAEALLAQHREAGYGPDMVWIDGADLAFRDDEARGLLGGLADWTVEEVG